MLAKRQEGWEDFGRTLQIVTAAVGRLEQTSEAEVR